MATDIVSATFITDDPDWRTNLNPTISQLLGSVIVYGPDGLWWLIRKAAGFSDYASGCFAGDTGADKGFTHDIVSPNNY